MRNALDVKHVSTLQKKELGMKQVGVYNTYIL
jgi:hypothetical protein